MYENVYYYHRKGLASEFETTIHLIPRSEEEHLFPAALGYKTVYQNTDSVFVIQNDVESQIGFVVRPFTDSNYSCEVMLTKQGYQFNERMETDPEKEQYDGRYEEYDYKIGIDDDSLLIKNNGYLNLKTSISTSSLFNERKLFSKDTGTYSELWFHDASVNKNVVIAMNQSIFSRFLTLFAVLFFIYFSVISLYILGNIVTRSNLVKKRFINLLNVNLRLRIHTTILFTILGSFLSVDYFTTYYLISNYKTNAKSNAIEKLTDIKSKIWSEIRTISDSAETMHTLVSACDNISADLNSSINLFDYRHGNLIHTTSSSLNNLPFSVNYISPYALLELVNNKLEYLSLKEPDHRNDEYLRFSTIRSPQNNLHVILEVPFHNSRVFF